MSTNVAQRRGKGSEHLKNQTILVPEENNTGNNFMDNHAVEDPSSSTSSTAATVHNTTTTTSILPVSTTTNNYSLKNDLNKTATTATATTTTMMNVVMGNGSSSVPLTTAATSSIGTAIPAKVRRNYCGTGPFDYKWLNLDCCGLLCAIITYMLHCYAIYTVLFILLPPWMNTDITTTTTNATPTGATNDITTGQSSNYTSSIISNNIAATRRQMLWSIQPLSHTMSNIGHIHSILFTCIAFLAIISHWYAMTTDPGSVPPDAQPITMIGNEDTESLSNNNNNNQNDNKNISDTTKNNNNNNNNNATMSLHPSTLQNYLLEPPASPTRSSMNAGGNGTTTTTTNMNAVKRICRRCKSYKPYRAHHCSICQRCIIKMDHHCPWINNCVGIGNHKYFLLFIFYTSISCLYSLLLIIIRFTSCSNSINYHDHHFQRSSTNRHASKLFRLRHSTENYTGSDTPHCLDRPTHLLFILALLVEAILFGLFTICMMMDQMDVVRSKVTHIDRYKGGDDNVGSHTMAGVLEVFGVHPRSFHNNKNTKKTSSMKGSKSRHILRDGRFRWDWLSPFNPVCFPSLAVRDEVIGFCRPCFPSSINYTTTKRETIATVPLQSSFAKNVATTSSKGSKSAQHKQGGLVEII